MLLTSDQGFVHRYIYVRTVFSLNTNQVHYQELEKRDKHSNLPRKSQDCYSDVYSLGVFMAFICRIADHHLPEPMLKALEDYDKGWDLKFLYSSYYSPQLMELIRRCRSNKPLERPQIYCLYLETKSGMEAFRDCAYQEEQESPVPFHHSKVLYTTEEQELFQTDEEYQKAYREANTKPVLEAEDLGVLGHKEAKKTLKKMLATMDDTVVGVNHWHNSVWFDSEWYTGIESKIEGSTSDSNDAASSWSSSSSDEAEEE